MALWDKVRQELDRAGQVAQEALDEGRVRLEAHRSRQLADKAAQALGYAVYRARAAGDEMDADAYARLSSTLASHEADVTRHEQRLADLRAARGKTGRMDEDVSEPPSSASEDEPPRPHSS